MISVLFIVALGQETVDLPKEEFASLVLDRQRLVDTLDAIAECNEDKAALKQEIADAEREHLLVLGQMSSQVQIVEEERAKTEKKLVRVRRQRNALVGVLSGAALAVLGALSFR